MRGKQTGASAKFLASLNGLQIRYCAGTIYLVDTLNEKLFKLPELYQPL